MNTDPSISHQSLNEAWREFLTPTKFSEGDLFISYDSCVDRVASVIEVDGTTQYVTERGDKTDGFKSRYVHTTAVRYTVRSEEWMEIREKFTPFPYAQRDILRSSGMLFLVQSEEVVWSLTEGVCLPYSEWLERGNEFELVTTRSGFKYSKIMS